MNKEKFIDAINESVYKSTLLSVESRISKPSGRNPSTDQLQLSNWYNSLNAESKIMIQNLIRMSVHDTIFGMLAVLDGVRAIEDTVEKGELKLFFEKGGKQTLINEQKGIALHDLFNTKSF